MNDVITENTSQDELCPLHNRACSTAAKQELPILEEGFKFESLLPRNIRSIDLEKTFELVVDQIEEKIKSFKETFPGLVVSVSGTDSALSFLACANAINRLGLPKEMLTAITFSRNSKALEGSWNQYREWLEQYAKVEILPKPNVMPLEEDIQRWADVQKYAISNGRRIIVGTRNASEEYYGEYSQASSVCGWQPIVSIYKTEVLLLSHMLGVPRGMITSSMLPDCECGRGWFLEQIEEKDIIAINEQYLGRFGTDLASVSDAAIDMAKVVRAENGFRSEVPWMLTFDPTKA